MTLEWMALIGIMVGVVVYSVWSFLTGGRGYDP